MSKQNITGQAKYDLIMNVFEEMYPQAHCELNYQTQFELLVAVLLSAQTTDKSVNIITPNLFSKYKTLDDYINVDIKELENDLRFIGLYKNKAKNLKKLAQVLKEKHNGIVPCNRSYLEALPGVGRKTTNVVLSEGFKIPAIAVDTHVERVSKRLKLAYLKDNVYEVEVKLMRKFPKEKWHKLHHQFIFFGRYHCKAKNPSCDNCKLKIICRYPNIHF
ncbi:endonuclease III [Mycoplasma sp. P36-A1]|uniref:endonuclease III n=1 Tax=Mycoplasma sp. P36-A1 TaxID=3252900 RepID=UPI003C30E560